MREFGLDPAEGHIVNGHVPVKRKDGESPIKCGGKVMGHRRRIFQSISEADRYSGLHAYF